MRVRRPTLFLDRDGTLIREEAYPKDPKRVKLLPGVAAGLRRLKRAGFPLVVISNQSGISRGIVSQEQLESVWARFFTLMVRERVTIDGCYWCPHRAEDHCRCRKPRTGLLKQAARDLKITWRSSLSVGDKPSDVRLGQRTGGWGILVLSGYGRESLKAWTGPRPDAVAKNFGDVVRLILSHIRKDGTWTISEN